MVGKRQKNSSPSFKGSRLGMKQITLSIVWGNNQKSLYKKMTCVRNNKHFVIGAVHLKKINNLKKELELSNSEISILDVYQSEPFWKKVNNLQHQYQKLSMTLIDLFYDITI